MEKDERQPTDHGIISESTTNVDTEPNISELSNPEKPLDGSTKPVEATETEYEYITGIKLWLVIASITLICFLMMLDMSIVVTVSFYNSIKGFKLTNMTGYPSNHH